MRATGRQRWQAGAVALLLVPCMSSAELAVIYDSGETEPMAPFLEGFQPAEHRSPPRPGPPLSLGAADPEAWLPIQSPGLTAGPVRSRAIDRPVSRPVFLIGADAFSRQWLMTHRAQLKAINAIGMLVQADSVADLESIADLAAGLPILPASARDIAKALGITHYPVLISNYGIAQ
jgi:integrating conjugative element protein (TIGR03765 family)